MTPIETFLVSVSVALISGITFVAYRHPQSYERIWKWLNAVILASWVLYAAGQITYSSGFSDGKYAALDLNKSKCPNVYLATPDTPSIRGDWDWAPLLATVYIALLSALPALGISGEKKEKG